MYLNVIIIEFFHRILLIRIDTYKLLMDYYNYAIWTIWTFIMNYDNIHFGFYIYWILRYLILSTSNTINYNNLKYNFNSIGNIYFYRIHFKHKHDNDIFI